MAVGVGVLDDPFVQSRSSRAVREAGPYKETGGAAVDGGRMISAPTECTAVSVMDVGTRGVPDFWGWM